MLFIQNKSIKEKIKKESPEIAYKAKLASGPFLWPEEDRVCLEEKLIEQSKKLIDYPFSEEDIKKE